MIEFRNVGVVYPGEGGLGQLEALRDVTLTIRQGEFFSLIGPSGCGKSTLLNVAAGLRRPTSGVALVAGQEMQRPRPDTISVVFQDYSLFPWRTVLGNIEAGLEFGGVRRGERRDRATRYLRMVGLEAFGGAVPRQLSGGMKQRVAIARALSLETPVMLMDEPFGALDEQTRMVLGEEVSQIFAKTDKTILFVTHSLAEAVFLSDRVAVMTGRPGRIREVIEVEAPHPRTPDFMTSKVFHDLRDHIFRLLHDEMRASVLGHGPAARGPGRG
ncbi:MAG: ABC transporter ATP-binding protein [Candidatus Rokubacteria bacterium]|nr:ABC transporter ATP-binding protein [Candidatus Rokubacteria bacterium]